MQCSMCGQAVSSQDRRCPLCGEELTGSLFTARSARPEPTAAAAADDATGEYPTSEYPTPDGDDHFSPFAQGYETGPRPGPAYSPVPLEPQYRERGPQPMMIPLIVGVVAILGLGLGVGTWWLIARPEPAGTNPRPAAVSSRSSETPTDDGGLTDTSEPSTDPSELLPPGNVADQAAVTADATSPDGKDSANNPVSYNASNLTDGDLETAWRMRGDGSDSSIVFRFDQPVTITELAMTNGYTKQDSGNGANRYQEERRITQVRWTTDDGTAFEQDFTDPTWDLQRLQIGPTSTSTLTLTITGTTAPGDPERDYTAISEVEITGRTT